MITRRTVRALVATSAVMLVVLIPAPALAHGIGGRSDLPVPLSYFIAGAGTAIVISFLVLAVIWPSPRLQDGPIGRPLQGRGLQATLAVLKWLSVGALLLVLVDGAVGDDRGASIGPVLVWVYFWLVIPYVAAVAGNVWRWISPWRTLGTLAARGGSEQTELAERLGVWPATVAFVAFTWLELVSPDSGDPLTLAVASLVYTFYILGMVAWLGKESGLASGGAFENYLIVISAIAPFDLTPDPDGRPAVVWRGWLRGLPVLKTPRGMTWYVLALIGTVTYDGLSQTDWWANLFGSAARTQWFGTLGLVGTVGVVGLGYYLAVAIAARLAAGSGFTVSDVADQFVHTLQPIALAYAFSHYFTLVLFEGQLLLSSISDPFGMGWDLFGTANWRVEFFLAPVAVWWIQLLVIVAGHIAGTVLAHDRALALFGERVAVRTQYAMLTLMVALTSLGLFILAG